MANDIVGFPHSATGANLYAIIRDREHDAWDNTNDFAFEAYATADLSDYAISLTEQGTASRYYTFTFPSSIPAGRYYVTVYNNSTPTEGDTAVAEGIIDWDGSAIVDGSNIGAVGGSSAAGTNQKNALLAMQSGAVATAAGDANTNTIFDTNLPTENDNYYGDANGGLVICFVSGTAHAFQSRRITASTTSGANTRITLDQALDGTPTVSDAFVALGRIEV